MGKAPSFWFCKAMLLRVCWSVVGSVGLVDMALNLTVFVGCVEGEFRAVGILTCCLVVVDGMYKAGKERKEVIYFPGLFTGLSQLAPC